MKKITTILLILLLTAALFAGCGTTDDGGDDQNDLTTIKVGASPTPHAEILAVVKDMMAEKGYALDIVEFTDYVQPNLALDSGEIDANYFQHQPYLDTMNEERGLDLVSVAAVHYEPFGIYAGKTATIEELADGASISVPNDGSNEARALLLLEAQGLIKLNPDAGMNATVLDITENPKNIKIVEMEAAQLARTLEDVDLAVINGNYAIQAGMNATTDALAIESQDSTAATTFANILVVKAGNEEDAGIKALIECLMSDEVKSFIDSTYDGAVVPMF